MFPGYVADNVILSREGQGTDGTLELGLLAALEPVVTVAVVASRISPSAPRAQILSARARPGNLAAVAATATVVVLPAVVFVALHQHVTCRRRHHHHCNESKPNKSAAFLICFVSVFVIV